MKNLTDAIADVENSQLALTAADTAQTSAHAKIDAAQQKLDAAKSDGDSADVTDGAAVDAYNQSLKDLSEAALGAIVDRTRAQQ